MPKIAITASFPILASADKRTGTGDPVAELTINHEGRQVSVTLVGGETYAVGQISQVEVSDELFAWLESSPPLFGYWPNSVKAELEAFKATLEGACRIVVETIKYILFRPAISDGILGDIADFIWSEENGVQNQIPIPPVAYMSAHSSAPLVGANIDSLQEGFDNNFRPLVGMRHLFRAIQETEPRFQWIDTTIALELAIKEALIRKCPEIESLLLEMPSPPLDKLYGSIMEKYLGVASTYRKRIQQGVTIRNKLIHRPSGMTISKDDASAYVLMAHKAIAHLLTLLYPEWSIAKKMEHTGPIA